MPAESPTKGQAQLRGRMRPQISYPRRRIQALLQIVIAIVVGAGHSDTAYGQNETALVESGANWRYLDDGSQPPTDWKEPSFDDSSWSLGPSKLGYGNDGEATVINFGPDPANKFITTFLRHDFDVAAIPPALVLELERDDGAIVFLNGSEVHRSNMPTFASGQGVRARTGLIVPYETQVERVALDPAALIVGTNTVAVSVHQSQSNSGDLGIDLELSGWTALPTASVTRRPYLQKLTPTSVVLRWRTDLEAAALVVYNEIGQPPQMQLVPATTEFEVELTGLSPSTTYEYQILGIGWTAGGEPEHHFETAPLTGEHHPARIWVLGDSGTGTTTAADVRDAYFAQPGSDKTDLIMMLGDNAYLSGYRSRSPKRTLRSL